MSLHHIANHLASKGRNGDTTLVHMTKGEVAGLQALAKAHGTTLTKNPDTGLPEAFGLKQLLPMAAGAALTPFVGPVGAAAIVGGLGYMQSGSLTQGLMAGLGAYGGAGLMGGVTTAGAQEVAGQKIAEEAAANQTQQVLAEQAATAQATNAAQAANLGAPGVYTAPPTAPYDAATAADMSYITPANQLPASTYGATATPTQLEAARASTSTYDLAGKGMSSLGTEAGRSAAIQGMGGGMGAAKYGLAAAAPIIADKMTPDAYVPPEIKGDTDMGQRYAYDSGYDNSVPGRTGQPAYKQISNEEAKKLYGFADGGEIQYPTGESVVRMAEGGVAPAAQADFTGYGPADAYVAARGLGTGVNFSGYDAPVNQGIAAVAPQASNGNPNQRIIDLYKAADARRAAEEAAAKKAEAISGNGYTIADNSKWGALSPIYAGMTGQDVVGVKADGTPVYGTFNADENGVYGPGTSKYAAYQRQQQANSYMAGASGGSVSQQGFGMAAGGGISTLGGYSDGGRLLKGPGDGMSDNIPAQIGAKQPARLADGEFVVPADVVSHLGNGSTDAGAKQLYKMMDKIRTARTGRKAQGKQVNPNKFLPA